MPKKRTATAARARSAGLGSCAARANQPRGNGREAHCGPERSRAGQHGTRISPARDARVADRRPQRIAAHDGTASACGNPAKTVITESAAAMSSRSCVVTTTVRPAAAAATIRAITEARPARSRCAVGSSRSNTGRVGGERALERDQLPLAQAQFATRRAKFWSLWHPRALVRPRVVVHGSLWPNQA